MRRKIMIRISCILLCTMLFQISLSRGANFKTDDAIADLTYHNNSTEGNPGPNVHSEIDIVSVEIDGVSILILFVETPIDGVDYEYTARIYWTGDDLIGNWTKCSWGGSYNQVHIRFEDSTGGEIIDKYYYDVISLTSKTLNIPIYNATMIPTILDPHIVKVYVTYYVDRGDIEFYSDSLDYATGTEPFSGFTFSFVLGGISLILMIGSIVKKKEKKAC